jgi:uncharacterized protein YegP (UPF0339 family)
MYFFVYRDQSVSRHYRWTLYSANHRKVANSGEGFVTRAGCYRSLNLLVGLEDVPIVHHSNATGRA